MPYIVNFTDKDNKQPITVYDNTSSTDTSLTLPGRNVTGYGQIIAENFISLLENFASASEPIAPIEGQLWYDSANGVLMIYDRTDWKAASNIQKGPSEPDVETSKIGELWVDTTNQQLRIFTGVRWILIGPDESSIDGLRYGPAVERISDTDNITRAVLIFYLGDIPVIIFSKDAFTPKISITGFTTIRPGININTPATADEASVFSGGQLPKLYGQARSADFLNVSGSEIAASKFLRSDVLNTLEQGLNIRNNNGVILGSDGTFELSTSSTAAKIYNKSIGSSLDLQVNRAGRPSTILRIIDNKVGINKDNPEYALDVDGSIRTNNPLILTDDSESVNLTNGALRVAGGASITKNLIVGTTLSVTGTSETASIIPKINDTYNLGSDPGSGGKRWNIVRAKRIIADEIQGVLTGNILGNANTANNLKNVTTFQLQGDITSPTVPFDGQVGSYTKIFNTTLTANIIKTKPEPAIETGDSRARSKKDDYVLVYRPSAEVGASSGLLKQTRDTFVGDLGLPIGAILPFAGAIVPFGFLLCDGAELEKSKYPDLFDVVGTTYNRATFQAGTFIAGNQYTIERVGTTNFVLIGAAANEVGTVFTATGPGIGTGAASTTALFGVNTFRVPDLRGRFPLGKDNMDNGFTVPNALGGYIDAGGGNTDRVPDTKADILGEGAGQSSTSLTLANIPEHTHNMRNGTTEYAAIRVDTSINPPAETGFGPTAPGQAQYLKNSGGVSRPNPTFQLGQPIGIMNPYLTINYIIRSGPPAFITVTS